MEVETNTSSSENMEVDEATLKTHSGGGRTGQAIINNGSATTATLLISPVTILSGVSHDRTMEDDFNREIKMILLSHNHHGCGGSSSGVAAPVHTFNSDIIIPVPKRKEVPELVSDHTSLEPVHGLVCFLNLDNYGSVLIYNPSTREKTAWIRTDTSELLEQVFLDQTGKGVGLDMLDMRTFYRCMFGFGYDSATKKHKVLCIYQIDEMRRGESDEDGVWPEYDSYSSTYCEVMTVGENIWREIDDIPSFIEDLEIEQQCKPVHVNGYICWMAYKTTPDLRELCDVVMVFDVGNETFGTISIPNYVLQDLWRLSWEERVKKWTNEIVEIDGHLAILNIKKYKDKDHWINLWILEDEIKIESDDNNVTGSDGGNWVLETLQMPYPWDELNYIAFKAVTGTDLIIVSYFLNENSSFHEPAKNEVLYCYNRKEKKCYRKEVDMVKDHSRPYDITTFFDTLTPVQTNRRSTMVQ